MFHNKIASATRSASGIAIQTRRIFCTLLVASTAAVMVALPARASEPSKLIETMTTEIVKIVKTKTGVDRQAAMRQLVRDNFDLPYMGRSALGVRWNQVDEMQRARFLRAVESSEARVYGERLGKYADYTVAIGKVSSRPNSVWIVDSSLKRTSGEPTRIEWEVHESGQGLRITDVKVEGISLSAIMRSDFNTYILSSYGKVEPLVRELEARAAR
jgi:phospholipid transport system substrate-binding protein